MAEERVERRLTAILAGDIAGYSRLMSQDETATLAGLRAHHSELIVPSVSQYHGRIVKLMGDGFLAEFGSAVEAVECAAHIQSGIAVRNSSVPDNRRMAFRIGVHVGDVIIDKDDIYGDGVNIAARLEGVAETGAFAFRAKPTTKSKASSHSRSAHWVRRRSRISLSPWRCSQWKLASLARRRRLLLPPT
jgi:adenylate cyclase